MKTFKFFALAAAISMSLISCNKDLADTADKSFVTIDGVTYNDLIVMSPKSDSECRNITIRLEPGMWMNISFPVSQNNTTIDLTADDPTFEERTWGLDIVIRDLNEDSWLYKSNIQKAKSGTITLDENVETNHFKAKCEMETADGKKVSFNIDRDFKVGDSPAIYPDDVVMDAKELDNPMKAIVVPVGYSYIPDFEIEGDNLEPIGFIVSDPTKVSVDKDGKITGVAPGVAYVTACTYVTCHTFMVIAADENAFLAGGVFQPVEAAALTATGIDNLIELSLFNWECDFKEKIYSLEEGKHICNFYIPSSFNGKFLFPSKSSIHVDESSFEVDKVESNTASLYFCGTQGTAFSAGCAFLEKEFDGTVCLCANLMADDNTRFAICYKGKPTIENDIQLLEYNFIPLHSW